MLAAITFSIDYSLDDESFEDFIELAAPISSDWAEELEVQYREEDGLVVRLVTNDDEELFITKEHFENTLFDVLVGKFDGELKTSIIDSFKRAALDGDTTMLDATDGDALLQLAAFGEIVYG
ncbi:MAG: hypothetical protein ACO23T_11665 [Hylemonella sp.]